MLHTRKGRLSAFGILYISDRRNPGTTLNVTTLMNGQELARKLMIVCENPIYIRGDFNTVLKKPAGIMADAVTFLSNGWVPHKSNHLLHQRAATRTEVNVSIIAGDLAPTMSNYGGGLENLPRFLEDWGGTEFVFRGSMVQLWHSRQAISPWSDGVYYTSPTMTWNFDPDLTDPALLPPATPRVRMFQRVGWTQQLVSFDS